LRHAFAQAHDGRLQLFLHVERVRVSIIRAWSERPLADAVNFLRQIRHERARRCRDLSSEQFPEHAQIWGGVSPYAPVCKRFVEDDPQRKDVGATVDLVPLSMLG
jgi:hypothetical protein